MGKVDCLAEAVCALRHCAATVARLRLCILPLLAVQVWQHGVPFQGARIVLRGCFLANFERRAHSLPRLCRHDATIACLS